MQIFRAIFGRERDRADEPKEIVDLRVGVDLARLLARASSAAATLSIASHGDRRSGRSSSIVIITDAASLARTRLFELIVQPRRQRVDRRVRLQQLVGPGPRRLDVVTGHRFEEA